MKKEISLSQVHRLMSPRPACLLTLRYKGQVNVMSVAWVCPVSLQPPLVTIAIHPSCYSHDMFKRSEEAVLNIPGRALAEQVVKCGTLSGADVDKVKTIGLTLDAGHHVQAPWIAECLAHVECVLKDFSAPGDHTLFMAEVLGAWAEEEAFSGTWLGPQDNEELHPLLHLGGTSFALLGKTITLR
jgi:flavin reductase (DIM6/NTAB) family NADH-FMN oxidoreductase RutF